MMNLYLLAVIILLEGFVTISAEILTIRQLMPVVGSNVITTSLIIGIFLLFLAIGYWRGGQNRQEQLPIILKKNFLIAVFLIGLGLSYGFIGIVFLSSHLYLKINPFFNLLIYLLLITAPLVYFLGQTVPITMNLYHGEKNIGNIGGTVLAFSTLGSFLGAIITTLLFINIVGVAWTVMLNVALLSLLVILTTQKGKMTFLTFTGLSLAFIFSYIFNVGFEYHYFKSTTNYANYRVAPDMILSNKNRGKILFINESPGSFLSRKKEGFPYIELIKKILFHDLKLKNKQILVLGAGGFSLTANGDNDNHFTYVDVDKKIYPIVKQYFLPTILGRFIAQDARYFMLYNTKKYDVIISDAYTNLVSIPFYLLTRDHLMNIRYHLTSHGYAIFNIIARPFLDDPYSKRVDNTIQSVFSNCMKFPLEYKNALTNILYVCKNTETTDNRVYTDNLTTITLDYYQAFQRGQS